MRHSGGVSLGAQAAPETLLHLRGNASAHGSLTIEAESADPPAPGPGKQARIYVKGAKLVVRVEQERNRPAPSHSTPRARIRPARR